MQINRRLLEYLSRGKERSTEIPDFVRQITAERQAELNGTSPNMTPPQWFEYYWRECRNDASAKALAPLRGAIQFAWDTGQITAEQAELWFRRIQTCPGHDDEHGRKWCAYCGDLQECPCQKPDGFHDED